MREVIKRIVATILMGLFAIGKYMQNKIEGVGLIENSKIFLDNNVQGDILQILRSSLADIRNQIAEEAKKYVGSPSTGYIDSEHGMDESGFDCSGFVTYILNKFGLSIENIRHVNEYFDSYGVSVHRELIQAGDLIFLSRDGLVPKHIGIVLSPEEYIHSPGKSDMKVNIQQIKDELIKKDTPGKMYSRNPIGFKRIVLESPFNIFDVHETRKKRRTKII